MTLGRALTRGLAAAGVGQVYGASFGDLAAVPVTAPGMATLLADAHRSVRNQLAATHAGDGCFVMGRGEVALKVDDPRAFWPAMAQVAELLASPAERGVTLRVDLDPSTPVPPAPPPVTQAALRWAEPADDVVGALRKSLHPSVLAGPEVVSQGMVPGLHALAVAGQVGVLNTWGAKGVFDWRSRHHWATVGLQAQDLVLGVLPETDLLLAVGLDPAETPPGAGETVPAVLLAPQAMDRLAERWSRPVAAPTVPPLRRLLAAVTQGGWERQGAPLAPTQATRNYGRLTAGRGLVAADAGSAGYWVARTFPTTAPGEALVPPARSAGSAVARAIVARLAEPARTVLAVTDAPVDPVNDELLEVSSRLGVPVTLEVWDPEGEHLDEASHLQRLAAAVGDPESTRLPLAAAGDQLAQMVAVAGPVTAWGGLA